MMLLGSGAPQCCTVMMEIGKKKIHMVYAISCLRHMFLCSFDDVQITTDPFKFQIVLLWD